MNIQLAEKFLSPARLSPYLKASNGIAQTALQLYADNARLAQGFYTSLSLLKISLRNTLHNVLINHFANPDWLIAEQQGFMIHATLPTYFDRTLNKQVKKDILLKQAREAYKTISKNTPKHHIKGERLIPELSFGFWTMLFEEDYYKVLYGKPLSAFSHRPKTEDRASINSKLFELRQFRNRIYHYEPLCFQNNPHRPLCLSQLNHKHVLINNLLSWLEPELTTWLSEFDSLPPLLQEMKTRYPTAL